MKTKLIMLLLATLCLAQLVAGSAYGYDATYVQSSQRFINVAYRYFQRAPACSDFHVWIEPITDQPAVVDGTGLPASGEADTPGCYIRFDPRSGWTNRLDWRQGWRNASLCTLFVHEYGHALGLAHTTRRRSVMNPLTMYDEGMPRECRALEEVDL